MSNIDKQSMKLYTEEQVKMAIQMADKYNYLITLEECGILNQLTPIELPNNEEIWRWWQTQKFQKEQGEQEYTMLYEIDLPKILKAFIEHFSKIQGGNNEK
jgi:hypothetical protein